MTRILITAAKRAAAAIALAVLGIPFSAMAQVWTANGCSGCHGAPPTIAASSGSGSYVIGVGESWMTTSTSSDTTPLLNRVHAAGTAQGVAAMQNLTAGEADSVFAYFVQLRDGTVSGSAPSVGSGKVGVAKSVNFSFTLTNYRDAATSFTVGVSGGSSGDYSVQSFSASGAAGCTGTTLPAASSISGVSCTISGTVDFTPSAVGSRTTTLTAALTSSPSAQTRNVYSLSGTGVLPNIAISPTSRSFTAKVGETDDQTFTISNSSSVVLDLTSITVSPSPQYTRNGGTCTTAGTSNVAASGGSCTVIVRFAPTAAGAAPAGTLSIGHDADNVSSPATASLSGTGTIPTISLSTSTVAFASSQLGVAKVLNGAITVTNTGNADLVFPASPFALSGANPSDFSFGGTCASATVTAGNTCTINGTFTPGGLGSRTATLTISSDASNGSQNVTLSGTGVALPEPTVTFPSTDFPSTVIGETASQTRQVTIQNDRTLDISYSVANTTDFNVQSESCPTRVVPGGGGSCTVTWRFQPQLTGGETRRTANVTFSFTGTGGNAAPSNVIGVLAGQALLPLGAPTSLAPSAGFGIPSTTSTLLSNRSVSAITLSTLVFSGAASADYSLDATNGCTAGMSLASGSSCTLVVRFNPSAGGTRNATLTITHNALGSPQAIALNGSATQGAIQLSSFALTFPSTALNASAQQSITVQNSGTQALNFSAFNLTGAALGDYTRSGDCAVGTPLAVSAQCTVTLTFQPTALGTRSASLTIQSDASNGPATVTLTGTGVPIPAPQVTLTPTGLDFGTQTVGNPYPARTIRLSNSGNADLHTSSVVVEGGAFATSSTCPGTLAPGAGCDVQIQFAPLIANTDYTGTLRVVSDAAGSPHTAPLVGRGSVATLAALTWSPLVAQVDFGTVSAGTLSAAQTVTLSNQGPGGVTLTVLNAVGTDATAFAVTGGTCAVGGTLFEGQTCTVQVQFAPAMAGARSAQLQVASTGSFPPTLSLVGTGLGGPTPGVALSLSTLDLGPTRVGAQSVPGEVVLSSNGSGSLQVTALAADGPFTVQTKTCPALPFTLPAGGQCSLTVAFVPQAQGGATGSLKVTTSASSVPTEIPLSGQGEAAPDLSSGGCSIAEGDTLADPTLWTLVALAVLVLWRRRAAAGRGARGR